MDKAPAYGAGDSRFDPGGGYKHSSGLPVFFLTRLGTLFQALFSNVFFQTPSDCCWFKYLEFVVNDTILGGLAHW
jgi:hypothetical protein